MDPNNPNPYQPPQAAAGGNPYVAQPQPYATSPAAQASYPPSANSINSVGGAPLGLVSLAAGTIAVVIELVFDFTSVSSWAAVYLPILVFAVAGLTAGYLGLKKAGATTPSLLLGIVFSGIMVVVGLQGVALGIHSKQASNNAQAQVQQEEQQLQQQEQQNVSQ